MRGRVRHPRAVGVGGLLDVGAVEVQRAFERGARLGEFALAGAEFRLDEVVALVGGAAGQKCAVGSEQ